MATLKDIARLADVSVDTVSRVLNGKAGEAWPSAVERAERIRKLAIELNYTPNKAARIMRTKKTQQIGVLVSELYNPATGRKVEMIADELAKNGFDMLLGLTRTQGSSISEHLKNFSQLLLDGIINLDPQVSNDDLKRSCRDTPFVIFNRSPEESPAVFDIQAAIHMLLEHLWNLGHRKIALVTGFDKGDLTLNRSRAFESFYSTRPHAMQREWIIKANWTSQEGTRAATELLKTDCTACVAGNDLLAIGLISGLRALGKEVPLDYSIVSPEDTLLTEISSPPLTTTHQPVEALAAITVDSLLRQINNQPVQPCKILPPHLTIRNSSTAPR